MARPWLQHDRAGLMVEPMTIVLVAWLAYAVSTVGLGVASGKARRGLLLAPLPLVGMLVLVVLAFRESSREL